jgi:hypothetical protein
MSQSLTPATPPTGVRMAPHLAANNTFTSYLGTPLFRRRIFSDIHQKNFLAVDPALIATPNLNGMRPGLYVHLGNISPQVHKATLERNYGITTEYVDELQLKWQQLKALGAKDHVIPNPSQPSSNGTPRFDPLDPDNNVWNNFYIDRRDAVMSEIFTKCLADRRSFEYLMEAVLPFWQARQQNQRLPKGNEAVLKNLALIVANEQLTSTYQSQIFDYLELLLLQTPPPETVRNANMIPEEQAASDALLEKVGQAGLTYVQAYKYVSQVFIAWLDNICRNGKPSPSSGKQHLTVARGMIMSLQDFPSFVPADTFKKRFDEYCSMLSAFADWMRVKFSREDYLLRIKYAHEVLLPLLPDQVLDLDRRTLMETSGLDDEYVQILCIVWAKLGIKPEPWMMHFSYSEETIRQAAQGS